MAVAVGLTEAAERRLVRMLRHQERELTNLKQRLANVGVRRHEGRSTPLARIRFRNDSYTAIAAFGVMRITGGSTQDFLTVDSVDGTYRWLYLVNGPRPVAAGSSSSPAYGFGSFLTSESFSARRNRVLCNGTPAYGEHWGVVSGSQQLAQHKPGFFILGGHNSTKGTAIAIQRPFGEIRVQNDSGGAVAAGSSASMSVFAGSAGTTDTGLNVTLTNASSVSWATTKYGACTADLAGLNYGVPWQT